MKEFKLISMVDFVLEQMKENKTYVKKILWRIEDYAKFLKQPLKLEFFVPCDEDGNVLKGKPLSPASDSEWIRWENEKEEFQKAKEKVLFEGFKVRNDICFNGEKRITVDYGIFIPTMNRLTIESLIVKNKTPLTLTESAIKQIGL